VESEDKSNKITPDRREGSTAMLAGLFLLMFAISAQAQWVMVGRAVAGRVQRMTQKSGGGGYDVATVILQAVPGRVYDTAVKTLENHSDVTITQQDSKQGKIEFRKGKLVAGLRVSPLGEKLTQLVIASSVSDATQSSATPLVLEGVLRVCQEMKVECSVQSE